jgi:hypothetical protein
MDQIIQMLYVIGIFLYVRYKYLQLTEDIYRDKSEK